MLGRKNIGAHIMQIDIDAHLILIVLGAVIIVLLLCVLEMMRRFWRWLIDAMKAEGAYQRV